MIISKVQHPLHKTGRSPKAIRVRKRKKMKNNFNTIAEPELIEVGNNTIERSAFQGRFISKGKSNLQKTIQESPMAGYGSCRACDCKGYISKHNGSHECKTCNHHYDRHN